MARITQYCNLNILKKLVISKFTKLALMINANELNNKNLNFKKFIKILKKKIKLFR